MQLVNPHLLPFVRQRPERVITVSSFRQLAGCPRRFTYHHSAVRSEESSPSLRQGNRWHSVLEALYREEDHPENDDTIRAFTREWDELTPLIPPEQPFLFGHGNYVIGGVIDLIATTPSGEVWVLDHKISTGQFMSNFPEMQTREQLGIYVLAVREAGFSPAGGVLSRLKFDKYLPEYIHSLAVAEGIETPIDGGFVRIEDGRIVRAFLVSGSSVLRVEREYFTFTDQELQTIADDLVVGWERLYGQLFRVRGQHCKYCAYSRICQEQAEAGGSYPIEPARLHPELIRRLNSDKNTA